MAFVVKYAAWTLMFRMECAARDAAHSNSSSQCTNQIGSLQWVEDAKYVFRRVNALQQIPQIKPISQIRGYFLESAPTYESTHKLLPPTSTCHP